MIKLVNGKPVEMSVAELAEYNAWVATVDAQALLDTLARIKRAAGEAIDAVYPTYKQLNLLRDGPAEKVEAMRVFINGVRKKSNDMEIHVVTLTPEALRTYVPTFE